jgi:hypothetical protein
MKEDQVQGSVLRVTKPESIGPVCFLQHQHTHPPVGSWICGTWDSGDFPKFLRMGLILFLIVLENLERAQADTATRGVDCSEIYTQTTDSTSTIRGVHNPFFVGRELLLAPPTRPKTFSFLV